MTSNLAPAPPPHATGVAVYPALFFIYAVNDGLGLYSTANDDLIFPGSYFYLILVNSGTGSRANCVGKIKICLDVFIMLK